MAEKVKLIDASKLLGVFCADCGMRDGSCSNSCEKDCAIYDTITSAPTVEAQPDNGWISVEKRLPDLDKSGADWVQRGEEYYCSHCGGTAPMDINRKHTVTTKFCPHCGYKMGG